MQAIKVKYLGPTDTRGSRLKASCERGSISIPYPHNLPDDLKHWEAAKALIVKLDLKWGDTYIRSTYNNESYFVAENADRYSVNQ